MLPKQCQYRPGSITSPAMGSFIESDPHPMPEPTPLQYATSHAVHQPPELAAYRRTLLGRLDRRILGTGAAKIVLGVLLGVALIVPSVQFVIKIQKTKVAFGREGGERQRSALGRWLPTAELLADPGNTTDPYGEGHWFPTPPMVLLSLVPLTGLGYTGAAIVWAMLKIAGLLLAMTLVIKGLGREGFAVPIGVIVAAGVYSLRPIIGDIQHGNLNIFMAVWLGIAWALYVRKKDFWAGLFVALAIVTKITPGLVLVYFLYRRAWRVCIGAGVGLVLVFVVFPGLCLGSETNLAQLHSWYDLMVRPFVEEGYATLTIKNQSLWGVVLRLLSNAGIMAIETMPFDQAVRAGVDIDIDMARPAHMLGRVLRPVLSLSVVAALGGLCRSRCASRRDPRLLLEFGLILIAMLLLSERTWKHHATTLPIVYLGVWYALTCVDFSDRFRAWFVAGLAVQFAFLVATSEGLVGDVLADHLLDGGFFCWGLLLCFVQIGVLLVSLNRRRPNVPDPVS